MTKDSAEQVKASLLKAIEGLTQALSDAESGYLDIELESLRRAVGLLIGTIQMDLLEPIYQKCPELDDLA